MSKLIARIDPKTGATYYIHANDTSSKKSSAASSSGGGYIDPIEEFDHRAFEYQEDEINDFNRVVNEIANIQISKRIHPEINKKKEENIISDLEIITNGPFIGFTKKLEHLIHSNNTIREIIGIMGIQSKIHNSEKFKELLQIHGAFFLEEEKKIDDYEIYSLMKNPPNPSKSLEEEEKSLNKNTIDAFIQERIRLCINSKKKYKFIII